MDDTKSLEFLTMTHGSTTRLKLRSRMSGTSGSAIVRASPDPPLSLSASDEEFVPGAPNVCDANTGSS